MTDQYAPVTDWATDFDVSDPAYNVDPFPIWDELRATCPIAHSPRYGGSWLPTRHDDVSAIALDTDHFTSRQVIVVRHRVPDQGPAGFSPPITSDPPFHSQARRILMSAFSPAAALRLEASTRAYCRSLLGALEGRTVVDAAAEYAHHIPVQAVAHMLGFPAEDADLFLGFVHQIIEAADQPVELEDPGPGAPTFFEYLWTQVEDHRAHPRDDLTSFLLNAELDGAKLDFDHVVGTIALVLIAGIDTTWSAIGTSLWHLATHPDDRDRLRDEPRLMVSGVEELLRAYAPVTMARLVRRDVDFRGCPMKAGDWVLLPFPAANRDPEAFSQADQVVLDRPNNRHLAFGDGIHRCLGAHLARMELRVALHEWLQAFPVFEVADPAAIRWSTGQIRGPRALPLAVSRPSRAWDRRAVQ
jgi:cytochrome P450